MDEFGYLSVLLSIIIGLAVTEILQGFRGVLQARGRVRVYLPVLAWAVLLLVVAAQTWWSMFGLRGQRDWTFGAFSVVLLQTIILYMQAGLIFPELSSERGLDLKAHFYRQHRWFFSLMATNLVISVCKDVVLDGTLPDRGNLAFHVVFFIAAVSAAVVRREWFHQSLALVANFAMALYIATLFARLR